MIVIARKEVWLFTWGGLKPAITQNLLVGLRRLLVNGTGIGSSGSGDGWPSVMLGKRKFGRRLVATKWQ